MVVSISYVVSLAFLAGGSDRSSDCIVSDESLGVQGNDMAVNTWLQEDN